MIFILNLIRHATFHGHNCIYVRRPDPFPFREGCGYARLGFVCTSRKSVRANQIAANGVIEFQGGNIANTFGRSLLKHDTHVFDCHVRPETLIARVIHQSPDAIKVSDRDTSHTYEYTSQGERIYGCKERPFIGSGLRLPRATSRPFYHVELAVFFSRLYEVQIHRYSTYMCLAANPGE